MVAERPLSHKHNNLGYLAICSVAFFCGIENAV
jgi:hypothetical protein